MIASLIQSVSSLTLIRLRADDFVAHICNVKLTWLKIGTEA